MRVFLKNSGVRAWSYIDQMNAKSVTRFENLRRGAAAADSERPQSFSSHPSDTKYRRLYKYKCENKYELISHRALASSLASANADYERVLI